MPRTGGIYNPPSGTKGTPNTTIQSAKYNALVDDLTADANLPRPITAGGTGASTVSAALTAFGIDKVVKYGEVQPLTTAEQSQALANIGAGYLGDFHNEIINGDFSVAQRGNGPFNAAGYTFDRWAINGGSVYLSREIGTTNQVRLSRSVTGLGTTNLYQKLEAARLNRLKPEGGNTGGVVTISFECAASGTPSGLNVALYTTDGDANFNNAILRGSTLIPVSGNTAFSGRKEFVVVLPAGIAQQGAYLSFSAETSNTASWAIRDVELCAGPSTKIFRARHPQQERSLCGWRARNIFVDRPAHNSTSNTASWAIRDVELCAGPSTKIFRARHPQQERSLCERFFYRGRVQLATYAAASNASFAISRSLPAVMRTAPSVNVLSQVVSTNLISNTLSPLDEGSLTYRITNSSVGFAEGILEFTAAAEL